MGDEPVRFGILGCANIAKKMSRAILGSPGTCLHAIGSRSLEKAQAFAKANGFPPEARVYGSYQSVLDDELVDVVYLPLPTSLHLEWVMKAIQRRKHILLEKPPALSVEDLDKMLSACQKEGLQFMDCTMFMHHPRTARMKEVLGNKDLFGEILEVKHCSILHDLYQTCRIAGV
jgi:predicted dehydrogenase